jgi:hypothetical protein
MKEYSISILRLLLKILVLTLALGAIAFAIGWIVGWRSSLEISNEFFVIGAILIGIGALSVTGGFMLRGNYQLNVAQSAGVLGQSERTNQNVMNAVNTYSTLIIFTLSGIILILCSIGIDRVTK